MRLEDALLIKSRPRWNSKRWKLLRLSAPPFCKMRKMQQGTIEPTIDINSPRRFLSK